MKAQKTGVWISSISTDGASIENVLQVPLDFAWVGKRYTDGTDWTRMTGSARDMDRSMVVASCCYGFASALLLSIISVERFWDLSHVRVVHTA